MADTSPARTWIMRLVFPALALVMIFFHLLPLDTLPRRIAPPDLLLAMAIAWCFRRPDFLPAWLLAATFLLEDLALQRPPEDTSEARLATLLDLQQSRGGDELGQHPQGGHEPQAHREDERKVGGPRQRTWFRCPKRHRLGGKHHGEVDHQSRERRHGEQTPPGLEGVDRAVEPLGEGSGVHRRLFGHADPMRTALVARRPGLWRTADTRAVRAIFPAAAIG